MSKSNALQRAFELYQALSDKDQQAFRHRMDGTSCPEDAAWLTAEEAAFFLDVSAGQVTRLAKKGSAKFGKLRSNGKGRGKYRIRAESVGIYLLRKACACFGHPALRHDLLSSKILSALGMYMTGTAAGTRKAVEAIEALIRLRKETNGAYDPAAVYRQEGVELLRHASYVFEHEPNSAYVIKLIDVVFDAIDSYLATP